MPELKTSLGRWNYESAGEGAPVLFLHGIFMNRGIWAGAIESLKKTRRCIAIDGPSHGASEAVTRPWTLADHAQALHEFIAEMKLHHPIIVGHSWGGMVAARYAKQFPEGAQRIVLVNTPLTESSSKLLFQLQGTLLMARAGRKFFASQAGKALFAASSREQNPELVRRLVDDLADKSGAGLRRAIDAVLVQPKDFHDQLAQIAAPISYITGDEDYVLNDEVRAALAKLGIEPHILPGGHTSPLECQVELVSCLDLML